MRSCPLRADVLELEPRHEVSSGRKRRVFEHENIPGALIKVLRPEAQDAALHNLSAPGWMRIRPYGAYSGYLREISESLVLMTQARPLGTQRLPIALTYGLVWTTLGLGLVSEKISTADGRLAPTMRSLLDAGGLEPFHTQRIQRFVDRCRELHVVLGDLHPGNIVFTDALDPIGDWVCVDGYGENAGIPVHRYSRFLNDRKLERQHRRLLRNVRRP